MKFLSNIPYAIIANIGFMAFLYLVYFIVIKKSKLKSAQLYNVGVLFQLLGAFQFIITLYSSSLPVLILLPWESHSAVLSYIPPQWFFMIGVFYFFILFFFIVKSFFQIQSLYHLKHKADYSDSIKWSQQINNDYFLPTDFKIGYSAFIDSPITFGWLDPVILLPFSICNHLSIEEIKTVLLHEIAHIIRYDYLVQIIISGSHWILYFNPFSYLFIKEISLQREMACDKWVIDITNSPLVFSKALYNLATIQLNDFSNHAFTLGILSRKNDLILRVQSINNLKNNRIFNWVPFMSICLLTCLIGFSLYTNYKGVNSTTNHSAVNNNFLPKKASTNNLSHDHKLSYSIIEHYKLHKSHNGLKSINNDSHIHLITKESTVMNEDIITNHFQNSSSNLSVPKESNENYIEWADQSYRWIKAHESNNRWVSVSNVNIDSIEYELAEKLLLQSVIFNYQSKKRALLDKMTSVQNEKEAFDFITNSKEWEHMVQYEKWVTQFLQKHPGTFSRMDSLSIY
jgi:beta-lactamase regulating signal transducer with metallopeptidase domain